MVEYLIDEDAQRQIGEAIDRAVQQVLSKAVNHGSEEGITPVLGHALMQQSFRRPGLKVDFNYRQLNKITEESVVGADGVFLVRVDVPGKSIKKVALFQAKLLKGSMPIRDLSMTSTEARRLRDQCDDMLRQTGESVAIFYTDAEIYVVDAVRYCDDVSKKPLSDSHRLITLGTYLGKWLPRCTRGDESLPLISRAEVPGGFKSGIELKVVTDKKPISWPEDEQVARWKRR